MDGRHGRARWGVGLILLAAGLASCSDRAPVEDLPTPEAVLAAAGKRLSRSLSAGDLTTLAAHGDRVLGALTVAERDALARGYVRFRLERPADVFVAAPRGSVPFWLVDQRFEPACLTLSDPETDWVVFRKAFAPGWVGLGVNGLDRSPPAHYAVFLRSRDPGGVTPRDLNPDGWQVSTAAEGMSLAVGGARPVADLPGALRGATLLRTSDDRRHATMLARGRVWKTHVVAGQVPDQVTVAFGEDPSGDLVWSWRTAPGVVRSVVRLRRAGDGAGAVREVVGGSETIAVPDLLNDPVVRRHTVRVSGLEPATAYEYTLGDGTAAGTSGWATVRTAPRGNSDVALIYMGDPQCGLEGWGKLFATAYRRRPAASAVLIAGDLVDRGNERTNWDHFFLRAAGVFERVAMMPCVGNHEYLDRGPWLYRAFFTLPANGPAGVARDLVYSFEVGDAFVAVLDSTLAVSDPSQALRQADWLDTALLRTRRTWKLVMFHHPVYASHPARESPALRDAWVPVFDRHHVDLVLQGHDHAYLRTYPLRAGRRAGSPAEGTVYVVSVSGDKYYDQAPREYTEVGFTRVSTYQTIDLLARQNRLVYRSFDASGRERDGFTIEKPVGPPRVASRAEAGVR
jgi:hypothetical protein